MGTYNFIHQLKPYRFTPKYLDIYKNPRISYEKAEITMDAVPMKKLARANASAKPTFAYVEDTTKSFFKASNINLLSGKKTEVLFAKDKYEANDSLEIDGYSKSQAFFKVDFKSKKLYGVLNSKQYLDATYIGRSNLNEIKKELVKDMQNEPFFSINKLKTQKIWDYEITNNSNKTQKISLVERVPVSKHEDIKVVLIGKSKQTILEKNGKITFDFELKPKEVKKINFGYEIEKPTKG